jgi:hypothetical protein
VGQEKVKLPTTPEGWAVRLSAVVKAAREIQKLPRFPIDVAAIARDYPPDIPNRRYRSDDDPPELLDTFEAFQR